MSRLRRIAILFCLIALTAVVKPANAEACGLDLFWCANRAFDDWGRSKAAEIGEGAAKGALDVFKPIIDEIMAQQFPQLISIFEGSIRNNILDAKDAGKQLTNHVFTLFDASFARGLSQLDAFVKGTIRQEIIDAASDHVNQIREEFFHNLDSLLEKNWYKAHCTIIDTEKALEDQIANINGKIRNLLPQISWIWRRQVQSACHKLHDIAIKDEANNPYTAGEGFLLWQCLLEESNTVNTPSGTIAIRYGDIEREAEHMMCLHRFAPGIHPRYVEYWIDAGHKAKVWGKAASSSMK